MKVLAGFTILTVSTIVFQTLHMFLILTLFSFSGIFTNIQFQATYWLSIYPFTNFQAFLFMVGLGYCGSIVVYIFSLISSRFTKKEYISLILVLLFLFIPFIVKIKLPVFSANMADGNLQLMSLSFLSLGKFSVLESVGQIGITVLSFLLILVLYKSFQSKKTMLLEP